MSLRIRRGTEAQRLTFTPDMGEIIWTTNGEKLYVGDGITPGGKNIAAQLAGVGLSFNAVTGKLDSSASFTTDQVAEGVVNKYFSNELAQDAVAAALVNGVHDGISFVYNTTQDNANRIDATVNLSLTTDQVAEGNKKYFSNELAQDAIASALVAGVHNGISFVYNTTQDNENRIDAVVSQSLSDLTDVVISGTPTDGQVLKYNSTASRWEAGTDNGPGSIALSGLIDVSIGGTLLDGQVLKYNSTTNFWEAGPTPITSLQDDLSPILGGFLNLDSHSIIGTGNINITGYIRIGSTQSNVAQLGTTLDSNDSTGVNITLKKSRGNTPVLVAGDEIFNIGGFGHDGTSYIPTTSIIGRAAGGSTISTGAVPGQIDFFTADSTGTLNRRILTDHLGNTSIFGRLAVQNFSYGTSYDASMVTLYQAHDNAEVRSLLLYRSRGTASAPAGLQNSDVISRIRFAAYNGASATSVSGASITASVDGIPTTNAQVPTRLTLRTSNGTNTLDRLTLYPTGVVGFNTAPELVAGINPGEVNASSVATYMKVIIGNTEYAIPAYAINL